MKCKGEEKEVRYIWESGISGLNKEAEHNKAIVGGNKESPMVGHGEKEYSGVPYNRSWRCTKHPSRDSQKKDS